MSLDKQVAVPRMRTLLSSLLNRDVAISVIDVPERPHALALYESNAGEAVGALQCDCAMTNFAGAALTMLPAGRVRESCDAGRVAEDVFDNASEVLNVLAQLFYEPRSAPVTLQSVTDTSLDGARDQMPAGLKNTTNHVAMRVEIDGYGTGTLDLSWT